MGTSYYGFSITFGKYGATHEEIHNMVSAMKKIDNMKEVELTEEVDNEGNLKRISGSLGGFR